MKALSGRTIRFLRDCSGATIVEYAVALIVVVVVGAAVFGLGGNVAQIIDFSAGAF